MRLSTLLALVLLSCACGGSNEPNEPARAPASAPSSGPTIPPSPASTPQSAAPASHANESCGELAMTRVGLIADGKGEQHVEVRGVDALLERCTDKAPAPEACKRTDNELIEKLARGYGENHPAIRSLRAKQGLCPK